MMNDETPPTPPPSPSLEAQIEAELAASASGEFLSQLEEEMRCSVCLSLFDDPRLMPCGHTFCRACLEQIASRAHWRVQCPHCRHVVHLEQRGKIGDRFPPNAYLRGVIERINAQAAVRRERRLSTSRHSSRRRNSDGEQFPASAGAMTSDAGAGVNISDNNHLNRQEGEVAEETSARACERRPFRILSGGGFNDLLTSCEDILTAASPPPRRHSTFGLTAAVHPDFGGRDGDARASVRAVRPMRPLESTLTSLLLAREPAGLDSSSLEPSSSRTQSSHRHLIRTEAGENVENLDATAIDAQDTSRVQWEDAPEPEEHRFAPFELPSSEVADSLQKWADSLWFAPAQFFARMQFSVEPDFAVRQASSHPLSIRPAWIPFWCFDVHTRTRVRGIVARQEPVARNVRSRDDSREVSPNRRSAAGAGTRIARNGPVRTFSCAAERAGHHDGLLICASRTLDANLASLVRELADSGSWRPSDCHSCVPLRCPVERPGDDTLPARASSYDDPTSREDADSELSAEDHDAVRAGEDDDEAGHFSVPVPPLDNLVSRDQAWVVAQDMIVQRETAQGEALLLREHSADHVVEVDTDVTVVALSYHLAFLPCYIGAYGYDTPSSSTFSFGVWQSRPTRYFKCVISAQTGVVAAERPWGLGKVVDIAKESGTRLREWLRWDQ